MQFILPPPVGDMLGDSDARKKIPDEAASTYSKWRPRLVRGAGAAGVGAFLGKTLSNHPEMYSHHVVVPTVLAGLAGVADAAIEEKMRQKRPDLAARGFDKQARAVDPSLFSPETLARAEEGGNGILGQLFAHRDRVGELARKQLGHLFPDGVGLESYGRAARLRPGNGMIAAMLQDLYPRVR